MLRGKTIFLCHGISSDANRAQFNRTRFLCQHYPLYIVANREVSPEASSNAQTINLFPLSNLWSRFFFIWWAMWVIVKIKVKNPDLRRIHCTYEPTTLVAAFILSRLFRLEWVADIWDDPEKMVLNAREHPLQFQIINLLVKRTDYILARLVLRRADKIILGLVPGRIISKYRLPKEKVLAVTNGINLDYPLSFLQKASCNNQENLRLFYCGAVDQVRLEGLPRCIELLVSHIPQISLELVGPEVDRGNHWLRECISNIKGNVHLQFRGVLPYSTVLERIGDSDICICPYPDKIDFSNTYPVKIFDYMVMGKPVVASGLLGTKDIVDHEVNGLVFSPGNYDQMAELVLRLYKSKRMRGELGDEARRTVQSFSWDKINGRILEFLES